MEFSVRPLEYGEKCSLCKEDYREYFVNQHPYGWIPTRRFLYIVQIGKRLKICGGCFYDIALETLDEYELEGLLMEKKAATREDSDKEIYRKSEIPEPLKWEVWERDNFTCLNCGIRRKLTIDHIKPESKGGETVIDNLQTLCRPCNNKKGTKTIDYRKTY